MCSVYVRVGPPCCSYRTTITSKRIATLQNPDVLYVHLICVKKSKSNGSRIKNPNNPARLPPRESVVVRHVAQPRWHPSKQGAFGWAVFGLAEGGQRHSVDFLLFPPLNKLRWRPVGLFIGNGVSTPVHHIKSSRLYSRTPPCYYTASNISTLGLFRRGEVVVLVLLESRSSTLPPRLHTKFR
jgi:hypothetical protein